MPAFSSSHFSPLGLIAVMILSSHSVMSAPLPMNIGAAPVSSQSPTGSANALGYFTKLGFSSPSPSTTTSRPSSSARTAPLPTSPPPSRPTSSSLQSSPSSSSSPSAVTITNIEWSTIMSTETLSPSMTTVMITETVTQTITSAPTPTSTDVSAWSLISNFDQDGLASQLAVKTWEWGQNNVAVLSGIPSSAWAISSSTPASTMTSTPAPTHAAFAVPSPSVDLYNDTVMQVLYPNGSINPANKVAPIGGTGMYMTPVDLSEATNVTFSYSVFFPTGFDFVKGGKLPGLYGGHTGCSGGQESEDCFSTRIMFRPNGLGELYLYVPKSSQPPALCQTPPLSYCNTTYGLSIGRGAWTFETGAWTDIRQDIILSTPGVADGAFQIFINGELKLKSDAVMFRRDLPPPTPATSASSSSASSIATPSASGGLLGGLLGGLGDNVDGSLDGMLGVKRRDSLPTGTALPTSIAPSSTAKAASSSASQVHFHTVSLLTSTVTVIPTSTVTATATRIITSTVLPPAGPVASLLSTPEGVLGSVLAPKQKDVEFIGIMFDTFFGGSDPKYASSKDQYSYFNRLSLVVNS